MASTIYSPGTPKRGVDASITAEAASATVLQLDLDCDVTLKGIPAITADGELPVGATLVNARQVDLEYPAGTFTAGADVIVPQYDPAIRTQTGGFVRPGMFPVDAPS